MAVSPTTHNDPFSGIVPAGGTLTVEFGPAFNQRWSVKQVTLEMPDAPVGAIAEVRYMASLIARSPSAKFGTASGEPPIFLQGGETMRVRWTGATPGIRGNVLVVYDLSGY